MLLRKERKIVLYFYLYFYCFTSSFLSEEPKFHLDMAAAAWSGLQIELLCQKQLEYLPSAFKNVIC